MFSELPRRVLLGNPGGQSYPVRTGAEQRKARYKLSEVAHRRKEVRIVPKGLAEKAENLLRRVVILGEAYQREDVPRRILVKTTAVGEDEYEAVAEELVEAGLAEQTSPLILYTYLYRRWRKNEPKVACRYP